MNQGTLNLIKEILNLLLVMALPWGFFIVLGYLSSREKQRRLEMIHQERMAAIEKGIPLPEMPELDAPIPPARPRPPNSNAMLALGIIFLFVGIGGVGALFLSPVGYLHPYWSTPLPLVLLGFGLLL